MNKVPKKSRQQFLDNDVISEKRKDYMAGPHGVGQNTPGGEMESPRAQIIDGPDHEFVPNEKPAFKGITHRGD